MNRHYLVIASFAILSALQSNAVLAFDFDLKSVRTTISNPSTSHALIYDDSARSNQKTLFSLEPINNQRVGVFFDINGIEIGYSADIFNDDVETKTQDVLLSYRKFKHSKITFNYQTLEGLQSTARNLSGNQVDQFFSQNTRSTKFELSGQHNFYTFNDKESLFEHFFLNRPKLSNKFDVALSIVGAWSFKHVSLEDKDNIVFQADFLNSPAPQTTKLISNSYGASIGSLISFSLPHNVHLFAEYKVGKGNIQNIDPEFGLKDSGDEKVAAYGGGISWTSSNKKLMVVLRAWEQTGRHIDTSFGDLSVIKFF
ncbi:hypothetical protein I6F65_09685 [Pseudoalteromonas sp. SWXJZ94C]|uniref:hypothetical protein n=1 Tax=unclassified Pseudoalteromonas TaxID=194690 RepID=UPI00140C366F|nr:MULTISPECIES: hypothetical protein [unclassified Pseudoalteromonas]MBH0057234.1 hypothetical protein [Pseudoalteromonas sp. SWXJZ94C]